MRTANPAQGALGRDSGHTLIEVLVSITILALAVVATVNGYVFASQRAEWSAHSLAANSLAMQRVEQARGAKWDLSLFPAVDHVISASFPTTTNILDLPISGTNIVYATNFTTISLVSTSPPLKMIQAHCIWSFINGKVYTNSVVTYRAPDQ